MKASPNPSKGGEPYGQKLIVKIQGGKKRNASNTLRFKESECLRTKTDSISNTNRHQFSIGDWWRLSFEPLSGDENS